MSLLDPRRCTLLVIDVQERYLPHLFEGARVVEGARRLIEGARLVGVPVIVTEQYRKGLGPTAAPLLSLLPAPSAPLEKATLSCLGQAEVAARLRDGGRSQVLVAGIEAHACVNQTVHDLLAAGYETHLAIDAISARFRRDYEVAIERLAAAGAVRNTVESALFEWVRSADSPHFQAVRALVREPLPTAGDAG